MASSTTPSSSSATGQTPTLVPDTATITNALTSNTNANATLTAYSLALNQTVIGTIPGTQPTWLPTLQQNLTTAQGHANQWVQKLGPAIFANLPQTIINASTQFTDYTNEILNTISNIQKTGKPATKEQKAQIVTALTTLGKRLDSLLNGPPPSPPDRKSVV